VAQTSSGRLAFDPGRAESGVTTLRVLVVITELNEGGAEHALEEIALRLLSGGHALHVAALTAADGPVGRRLAAAGVPVTDLGATHPGRFLRSLRVLRGLIDAFRPNVVYSWLFHANLTARLATPADVPIVAALRVVEPRLSHRLLERLTRRRVARWICVSRSVARFAEHTLGVASDRIEVIENGVILPARPPAERPRDRLEGLTVARISRQKGLDVLVDALARFPAGSDWRWKIAGAVEDRSLARRLEAITEARLGERLQWLGPVPREDMPALYRTANLFALPSRWEGQPNALLEAFSWRLPCVAAAVPGIAELAEEAPGCVELTPPNDPGRLAAAILRLHEDAQVRRERVERAWALVQHRSWDRTAKKTEEALLRAAARL